MAKNLSGLDVRGRKQQLQLQLKHWTESEPQDFPLTTTTRGLNTPRQSCLHPADGAIFQPLYELLAT